MVPKPYMANMTENINVNLHDKFHDKPKGECDAEKCLEAKAKLFDLRAQIVMLCDKMKQKMADRIKYAALAAAYFAIVAGLVAAAAAVGATIIGIPVAAILLAEAAAMTVTATIFLGLALTAGLEANKISAQIFVLKLSWSDYVIDVMVNCPEKCWPDFNLPSCL